MYLNYYRLRRAPFGITPDPAFLYLGPSHKEALAAILYGIENRKGFISITGEVGCGKTTLLKAVLSKIDPDRVKAVYLFNPDLSFDDLVGVMFEELGLGVPDSNLALVVRRLQQYLIENYRQGKHVALIIDEAQCMPVRTLEWLRILSNLETAKDKLLQIVLCGQPEFEEMLKRRDLRQLRQRIAVRATIQPLSFAQSMAYMKHRLGRVAYSQTPVFSSRALKRVARYAKGIPRTINIVCDNALIAGYADQERPITAKTVRKVIAGMASGRKLPLPRWALAGAAGLLVLAGVSTVLGGAARTLPQARRELLTADQPAERAPVTAQRVQMAWTENLRETVTPVVHAAPDIPEIASAGNSLIDTQALSVLADEIQNMVMATPVRTTNEVEPGEAEPMEPAAPLETEDEVHQPAVPRPATWIVRQGDTLGQVLVDAYGFIDADLIQLVMQRNPQIRDANRILAGDTIALPELEGSTSVQSRED